MSIEITRQEEIRKQEELVTTPIEAGDGGSGMQVRIGNVHQTRGPLIREDK